MCGITGIISKTKISENDIKSAHRMEKMLIHRGPDGRGEYISKQVLFTMRRLSIIDVEHGWQPLWNEDKSIVLIANGEIYNYIELRSMLKSKGHGFRTNSDCETIIHLYEQYGLDFVHYLRGMFAFALYDIPNQKVFLYRDRLGEKPLYYFENESGLYFSSELKSIVSSGVIPFEFDIDAVNDYFFYQYVPEPLTPIKNLLKLTAGSFLEIDLENFGLNHKTYWTMDSIPELDLDPVSAIRSELDHIHSLLIRADVPVGVALSGGLDSSAIAALAAKHYPGTIQAFSVGYPGRPSNDERNDAIKLAKILNIPIHEIELNTQDLVNDFEEMNFFRDDPIADISGYGYFAISREAKKRGVPVLLQGQGGDEIFWGYPWVVRALEKTERYLKKENLQNIFLQFYENLPTGKGKREWLRWLLEFGRIKLTLNQFLRFRSEIKERVIFYDQTPDFQFAERHLSSYTTKRFKNEVVSKNAYKWFSHSTNSDLSVLFTNLIAKTYLLENGIAQGDRLSMASSVELRLPFVDYKLFELVIGLRKNKKYSRDYQNFPKPWLRSAMKGILPEEIMNRPKRGFSPPIHEWYSSIFKKYGSQLVDGELVNNEILSPEGAKNLSEGKFPAGTISPISFKALVLENWTRQIKKLT